MEFDLSYLTNILNRLPGNILYHLVISLSLLLISGLVIPKLNRKQFQIHARQSLTGCTILLVIQVILFSASLIEVLPPLTLKLLESLAANLTIIWLIWLFQEDDPQYFLTGVNIFLTLALMIIAVVILILTVFQGKFIQLDLDMIIISWQFGALLLIALGMILLVIKRSTQWVVAICILILLALGHGLEIILQDSLELKLGAVRLAQMLSIPWSTVVLQQYSKTKPVHEVFYKKPEPVFKENRVDTKPTLIEYLLKISIQKTKQDKYNAVARALSLSVLSDICCLFQLNKEAGKFELLAGYDLIREALIPPASLSMESFEHILKTWQENRILKLSHLYTEGNEVDTLKDLINYPYLGNLLAYPLLSNAEQLLGGIVLLSPYTNKSWDQKTINLLDDIKSTLSQVLFEFRFNEILEDDFSGAKIEIQQLIKEKERLEAELVEKEMIIQEQEKVCL